MQRLTLIEVVLLTSIRLSLALHRLSVIHDLCESVLNFLGILVKRIISEMVKVRGLGWSG